MRLIICPAYGRGPLSHAGAGTEFEGHLPPTFGELGYINNLSVVGRLEVQLPTTTSYPLTLLGRGTCPNQACRGILRVSPLLATYSVVIPREDDVDNETREWLYTHMVEDVERFLAKAAEEARAMLALRRGELSAGR